MLRALVDSKIEEVQEIYKSAKLVGRKNAARLLEMSESQFDRQVRDGKLANIYINRRTRVTLRDLEKYVEARRMTGRPVRPTAPKKDFKSKNTVLNKGKAKKPKTNKSRRSARAKK
jgi:hypothetical protein